MKHSFHYLFALILLLTFAGCKEKKVIVVGSDLPVFEFASTDTTAIMALADEYMSYFKAGQMDSAANMLYLVRNDSILPLPEEQKQGFLQAVGSLPIVDCQLKELKLFSDRDNELRIALQIAEQGDLSTGEGCINFFLNPVSQDSLWYLTLRSEYGEGVGLYHKK